MLYYIQCVYLHAHTCTFYYFMLYYQARNGMVRVRGGPLQHATSNNALCVCACCNIGRMLCSRNFPCGVPVVYVYGAADAT